MFSALIRDAEGWLARPDAGSLAALVSASREAERLVPAARRADWDKLLSGFERDEPEPKRRARVEGLVRACRLFAAAEPDASALRSLRGVGPAIAAKLADAGVATLADLLWIAPVAYDDLRAPIGPGEAAKRPGERVVVTGVVKSATRFPMRGRRGVRVVVRGDDGAELVAIWFYEAHGALQTAKVGAPVLLVGRPQGDKGKPAKMAHPDLLPDAPDRRVIRPRYPRILPGDAVLRKAIAAALAATTDAPDPVPPAVVAEEGFAPAAELLRGVHGEGGALPSPPTEATLRAFFERLAWAEAFAQVFQRLAAERGEGPARAPRLPVDPSAVARLRAALPYSPTADQEAAVADVANDLASETPMRRLLLGDVGTGKTLVALFAAAQCVAAKHTVAILAPTVVLADQYLDAVAPLAQATGARIASLTGAMPKADADRVRAELARGGLDVVIGTHALFSDATEIPRLGLVVVDEQQRLGVAQRLALVKKGGRPHLLSLSATPIPRTLALVLRGELASSSLTTRPAGRPPVATSVESRDRFADVVARIAGVIARGERVFVVTPRIAATDEDEDDAPTAAEERGDELARALAPARVVVLHGRMKPAEKAAAMRAFRDGRAMVLVGTTVVEVGVDVPEATLMVIDGAERFGLSQLHQLRGRVGRGDRPGSCVLVHDARITDAARERLDALVRFERGDDVARADLEARGAGDLSGERQSGAEDDLAWLARVGEPPWLARIEGHARAIALRDPDLVAPVHATLRGFVRRLARGSYAREEAG